MCEHLNFCPENAATYVRILLNDHVKHRHSHTVLMKVCDVTDTDAPQGGSIIIQTTQTLEESYCKNYGMLWKKENKKLLCNIFPAVSGIKSGWQESVYTPFGQLHRSRAHSSGFIHTQSLHCLNWLVYALGVEAGNKGGLKEKQKTAATGHGVLWCVKWQNDLYEQGWLCWRNMLCFCVSCDDCNVAKCHVTRSCRLGNKPCEGHTIPRVAHVTI